MSYNVGSNVPQATFQRGDGGRRLRVFFFSPRRVKMSYNVGSNVPQATSQRGRRLPVFPGRQNFWDE